MDPSREKDTAVEKCNVSIEDGEGQTKSRFVIKMICRHGMLHLRKHYTVSKYCRCFENLPPDI